MTKEQLKKEIVKLVCENGKGMSLQEAATTIQEAIPLFLETVKLGDGALAQSKE